MGPGARLTSWDIRGAEFMKRASLSSDQRRTAVQEINHFILRPKSPSGQNHNYFSIFVPAESMTFTPASDVIYVKVTVCSF